MQKTALLVILLATATIHQSAIAQKPAAALPANSMAPVIVAVADSKKQPLKNEQVLFIGQKSRKQYSGMTEANGQFKMQLPTGDVYLIKLKTLNDTANYSQVEIPALGPGQFFEEPFTIDIQYEPARTYTLNNVHFDTGKPTLRPESYRELNEIIGFMKLKPGQRFEIAGHTDNQGRPEDNLTLSQQRAESVKNYLVKKGIEASRLVAKGYGATQPVADNSTEEGRQKNRRTEVTML